MMKTRFLLFLMAFCACFTMQAQNDHVSWTASSEKVKDDIYEITVEAKVEDGWHIYDIGPYKKGGPLATKLNILPGEGYEPYGETVQLDKPSMMDKAGMSVGYFENSARFTHQVKLSGADAVVHVEMEWMACTETNCTPPMEQTIDVPVKWKAGSIWGMILQAIIWGFVALLTPCVFPMVPMTVSFFLKKSQGGDKAKGRVNAFFYGLFIVLLYTLPVAIIIGITYFAGGETVTADIFNWLATHWLPNLLFFLIFMVFAASFFGAFEIVLPSKFVNGADSKSDRKGLLGIFFMALTLVLVSFSCTGPIVGTVLIKSTQGEVWAPIVTMLAFSVAFALPFTVFAFAPSLLKNLPKSGGWLNSVKVVLGFVEVALGFKFLGVADQTYHWGLLDREVYLAIWIVVFTLLGLYLLGKIKFKYDSPVEHLSVFRLVLVIVDFTFVVYMIPGMWGAPLKALSGYLPPITTQDFVINSGEDAYAYPYTVGGPTVDSEGDSITSGSFVANPSFGFRPKYSDFLHLPHGIQGFFDYKEALEYARKVGKPMFIDLTGHGCVNCREMEMRVWSDPRVLQMMKGDYVVCALYVDDKKEVDEKDWVVTENGKVLKSLGKINSHFAEKRFNVNAQPFYAIVDPATEALKVSHGYDLNIDNFIKFLEDGKR